MPALTRWDDALRAAHEALIAPALRDLVESGLGLGDCIGRRHVAPCGLGHHIREDEAIEAFADHRICRTRPAQIDMIEVAPADPASGMLVACGSGAVHIREVKPAGKRRMTAAEWLRGRAAEPGDILT